MFCRKKKKMREDWRSSTDNRLAYSTRYSIIRKSIIVHDYIYILYKIYVLHTYNIANWIARVKFNIFPLSRDVDGDSQEDSFCTHLHFSSRDALKKGLTLRVGVDQRNRRTLIAIYPEQSLFLPRRVASESVAVSFHFRKPARFRRRENSRGFILSLSARRKEGCSPRDELAPETRYKGPWLPSPCFGIFISK